MLLMSFLWLSASNAFCQADVLDQIEAELNAEKEKQKALEKAQKNAEKFAIKYTQTINKADVLLKSKKFDEAIEAYKEAITYKPDDHYAPEQIKESERLKKQAEEEAKKLAIEASFKEKLDAANASFTAKKWDEAIALFEEAKKIKPSDPLPSSKIAEANKLKMKEEEERKAKEAAEALQKQYDELLFAADKLLADQNFDEARAKYQEASKLKPSEQLPKNKILECDKLKADFIAQKKEQETQAKYEAIVAEADELLKTEKFDEARNKYDEALKVKPNETYPHKQIAECDRLKKEFLQKEKDEQYANLIKDADKLLGEKAYDDAKTKYEEALKFKPGDAYATKQVIEADKQKKQDALDKLTTEFNAIITEGDELVRKNEYDQAIETYDRAHKLMPSNTTATKKVKEATELKKQYLLTNKKAEYDKLLAAGDELLKNQKFEDAIAEYAKAEHLFPENPEAQKRIENAKQERSDLELKGKEERYRDLLSSGDEAKNNANYDEALRLYTEAEKIFPAKNEAQTKVHELNEFIKKEKEDAINNEFSERMSEGDKLLSEEKFEEAEAAFQKAHKLKPKESSPNTKIQEVHKRKAEKIAKLQKESSEKEKQEKFSSLMQSAKDLHSQAEFQKAISTYHLALEVIPNESSALSALEVSKKALKDIEQKEQEEAKNLAHQQNLEKQYLDFLNQGDQALQQREFATAREKYNKAASIFPDRTEHAEKLTKADADEQAFVQEQEAAREKETAILAEKKRKEEAAKARDEQLANYETLLDKGNKALATENFDAAMDFYAKADELFPEDGRAKKKLEDTRKAKLEKESELLAEKRKKEAAEVALLKAKEDELKQKETQAIYDDLIRKGNTAMSTSKFDEALRLFSEAETKLPGKQQTADFIAMARERLEKQNAMNAQQQQQAEFETFFKNAEQAFKEANFDLAFTNIDEAKRIKPEDPILLALEKKIEKKALEEEEKLARQLAMKKLNTNTNSDFTVVYLDPKRRERLDEIKFVHDLASKYPEGLTVQYRTDDRKEVEVRIVVQKTLGAEYQKVTHDWGGTYYFKNGKNVSAYIWQKEAGGL